MTMYDSTDFASTEFARHPDGMIAANLGVGVAWHGHLDARQEFLVRRSEDEMARGGWAPVLECPDPGQHGPIDYKVLLEQAERERDKARGALRARLGMSAQPRPLTADDITDEMVERAREEFFGGSLGGPVSGPSSARRWRAALTAALTGPPARPEGAEEWEDWLIEALPHESMPDEGIERLADQIAARATRRVEEDR